MKTYTYNIYQKCTTETRDTYTLQAKSKKEADKLIKQFAETGDSYTPSICCIDSGLDLIWDALEPTSDKPVIVDENNEWINE